MNPEAGRQVYGDHDSSRVGSQRARADAAGVSIETYLERIARDDQAAEEELEAIAVEGLKSGKSIEADEQYWKNKHQRLTSRDNKTGRP